MLSHLLLLFISMTFAQGRNVPAPLLCIQGDASKTDLRDALARPALKGSLLAAFQIEKRNARSAQTAFSTRSLMGGVNIPGSDTQVSHKDCASDHLSGVGHAIRHAHELMTQTRLPQISKTCVTGALRRENNPADNTGFLCSSSEDITPTPLGNPTRNGPCVEDNYADYVTWSLNKAISCVNDPKAPLDPLMIFKKMNNESLLHFYTGDRNGKGAGQLTSIAVQDVNQLGLIERVSTSTNPDCLPFQQALSKEFNSATQVCPWIEPSEGFARNLIYSLLYFTALRESRTNDFQSAITNLGIENVAYRNYATLAAYGAQRPNTRENVLAAIRKNPRNVSAFQKQMTDTVPYIQQIESKFKEALLKAELTDPASCLED